MEAINTAWQNASQEMYAAQEAAGGADAGAGATGGTEEAAGDDGVSDVEYEEVDDKK